jgi:hypothetical protein
MGCRLSVSLPPCLALSTPWVPYWSRLKFSAAIGGALVGTFLGVLLAYGLVLHLGSALKALAEAEIKDYLCMKAALVAHMQGHAPMIAVEFARKSLFSEFRPTFSEVEEAMNDAPSATQDYAPWLTAPQSLSRRSMVAAITAATGKSPTPIL